MKNIRQIFNVLLFSMVAINALAQETNYLNAGNGNPLVPGYFADPTVKKIGDTYYIYATTDGVMLASGEPQVWVSKDFVNWFNYELNLPIPNNMTNCWAPDLVEGPDGKFYYFNGNCEPGLCYIYGYKGDTPVGPFEVMNGGKAVIPAKIWGNYPSLDAQYLLDGDTALYAYFGTWAESNGGLGAIKVSLDDYKTILDKRLIPASELPGVFEGAYMLKRNGKYILMYSSGDCRLSDYRVRYSYGDNPMGPFSPGKTNTEGESNTILESNGDGTIDSPGHHSVLKNNDDYFIVYHRHDNPHSGGGEFRQLCVDSLIFRNDTTIDRVNASHTGIGYLATSMIPYNNLAYQVSATATSFYHQTASDYDYTYEPAYATDNNNGTMWKAATQNFPQSLCIDLGQSQSIKRVMTEFEYTTFYYQYYIEYSDDSLTWQIYVDRTANKRAGCPMVDDNEVDARYLRITITGMEKTGFYAAIWNIKVYDGLFDIPVLPNLETVAGPGIKSTNNLLVDFNMEDNDLIYDTLITDIPNKGSLGGTFARRGKPTVAWIDSVRAMYLSNNAYLRLSSEAPASLEWNAAYTASAWVLNPVITSTETVMSWCARNNMGLQSAYTCFMYGSQYAAYNSYGYTGFSYSKVPTKNKWHHIALTFDGMAQRVYVDGVLNNDYAVNLMVEPGLVMIGSTGEAPDSFNGYIANAQLFDSVLNPENIIDLMEATRPVKVSPPVAINENEVDRSVKILYSEVDEQIQITTSADDLIQNIQVIAMDGKVIKSVDISNQERVDLNFNKKGIYLVVVRGTRSLGSGKIIVH